MGRRQSLWHWENNWKSTWKEMNLNTDLILLTKINSMWNSDKCEMQGIEKDLDDLGHDDNVEDKTPKK
jgi:hypothetical protein